jgi:hypothetical protein
MHLHGMHRDNFTFTYAAKRTVIWPKNTNGIIFWKRHLYYKYRVKLACWVDERDRDPRLRGMLEFCEV